MVRPAVLYSSITYASKRRDKNRIDVTEMRMLSWQCGLNRKDIVKNKHFRDTLKIAPASTKVRESRLRWYGHTKRREEDHPIRKMMDKGLPVGEGWMYLNFDGLTVKEDVRELGLIEEDALDRRKWKNVLKNHYSAHIGASL
ncbi:uncharacterized protein [Palaemon carinicauda]|uniref:uncharacterized protein n=1 Tax=Palaemon carinicauda TaxID=392227 RepID=UPI0035B6736C